MALTPWPPLPRLGERGSNDGAQRFIGFVPDIVGEGFHVPGGVDQFQHARDDEAQILGGVGIRRQDGELFDVKEVHVNASQFLTNDPVER